MKLKLNRMEIRNFMGIKELDLYFGGGDATIAGDNGTGKTTVKSAFSWLLFGKNTFGKTDFQIKPLDAKGDVIHNLITSVEAEFEIDGARKIFKRTLQEKWSRQRGAATATFSGNTIGYFINDVPKKKSEYSAAIDELISEDVFKIITDPLYFNEQLDWKKRRLILMDICGEISDAEVIAKDEELQPLLEHLNGITVDELKEMTAGSMRTINGELDVLPAKINEAEFAKQNIEGIVIDHDRRAGLAKEIDALHVKKLEILNGIELMKMRAEQNELERKKAQLKPFNHEDSPIYKQMNSLAASRKSLKDNMAEALKKESEIKTKLQANYDARQALSQQWDDVSEKRFTDDTCPLCGREFDPDVLDAKRKEFNLNRAKELDDIEAKFHDLKVEQALLEKEIGDVRAKHEADAATFHEQDDEIQRLGKSLFTEKEAHEQRNMDQTLLINNELLKLRDEISAYESSVAGKVETVDAEIKSLQVELDGINKAIALVEATERQEARIKELEEQQVKLSAEYTRLESVVFLCEQFIKRKVELLNEKINSNFKFARFKLFGVQVNGGIAETCETTFNGVPYSDLNNAMRINVGLDVINTMCKKFDASAPIFIDNAEAVTHMMNTASQQIKLRVDENYKELTQENERR